MISTKKTGLFVDQHQAAKLPEAQRKAVAVAYQRGKQYRSEQRQGQRTDLTSGNESQKPCPKFQTAARIAATRRAQADL